ncbi:Rieske 2Fe-2S domain-containing protein [Methylomarinum sp. Ch1-1]|uniref:Rieske 2Fe-2S domain-containing protein n=1 Tax=Methylomarinum roseum TaxID=3067653 RepID=A0AAU7NYM5_9GAMM|nr:Rieske 2Fe-2S domain-containing protein [Methylomarinum sp. Ch1-1]MDP4521803.1 Rieske 2Fe-2S domain-containing protein [Methylomarinum sp. Ch1-1]
MDNANLQFICSTEKLLNLDYLICHIEYRENKSTAVIFYYDGQAYAYLNNCRHRQRRLDCEADTVFDANGQLLSCSMHGYVFEPTTGECMIPPRAGKKLQSLRIVEQDGALYFADERVRMINPF